MDQSGWRIAGGGGGPSGGSQHRRAVWIAAGGIDRGGGRVPLGMLRHGPRVYSRRAGPFVCGGEAMKLKLISCEVLYREMCAVIARSPNEVDVEFLPKGLHDIGCSSMRKRLQDAIDKVDAEQYEA